MAVGWSMWSVVYGVSLRANISIVKQQNEDRIFKWEWEWKCLS